MKELQSISMFHESMEHQLSVIEKHAEKIEKVEQKLSDMDEMIKNKCILEDKGVQGKVKIMFGC